MRCFVTCLLSLCLVFSQAAEVLHLLIFHGGHANEGRELVHEHEHEHEHDRRGHCAHATAHESPALQAPDDGCPIHELDMRSPAGVLTALPNVRSARVTIEAPRFRPTPHAQGVQIVAVARGPPLFSS